MINRYNKFCPLEQRTENAERIRRGIANDMENGNELCRISMFFSQKFITNYYDREEIFSDYLLKMSGKSAESFRYIVYDSKPIINNFKFKTWTISIIRNLCIDYLRFFQRHKREMNFTEENIESIFPIFDSSEQELIQGEKAKKIRKAIPQLSIKQQDLINMFYFERTKYREIASKLDIPIGSVKSGLYLAKNQLRKKLVRVL